MRDRVDQQLLQVERSTQAGRHNRRELPVEENQHQTGRQAGANEIDGLRRRRELSSRVGQDGPEAVPDQRRNYRDYRAAPAGAQTETAHAQPLRAQDRRDHSQSSLSKARSAPTTRTKTSSSVSEAERSSCMAPSRTIFPWLMMATRSQSRSTTSSTCEVRNIVAPWRT